MTATPHNGKETDFQLFMALLDGDNGMGHLVMRYATQTAIAKAKQSGVGVASVMHSTHYAAGAYWALMAVEQDMIGLVYPGINRLDYDFNVHGGVFPSHVENHRDPRTGRWLERVKRSLATITRGFTAGRMVGEYRVTGLIGEGGMGTVYAGIQPLIGKKVAIKVLKAELSRDPEVMERFLAEARAVNRIGHSNIVDVFSFGAFSDGAQ